MTPAVIHCGDAAGFADASARHILGRTQESLAARGSFRLGLCGGNTPRPVLGRLAELGQSLDWRRVLVTFGDERCVPPDDAKSNYRMAKESFLDRIDIPAANVFRMRGELPPDVAAEEYGRRLAEMAAAADEPRFRHDLLLLGVGDDGHTTSLFPGTSALDETEKDVAANFVPGQNAWRITLTFPVINAAREVAFLVGDRSKADVVSAILAGASDYPAARVAPGSVTWFLGYPG